MAKGRKTSQRRDRKRKLARKEKKLNAQQSQQAQAHKGGIQHASQ